MGFFKQKAIIFILMIVALIFGAIFIWVFSYRTIEISDNDFESQMPGLKFQNSPISGLSCQDYNRRPIAVILAEDPVTRPLAGISEADLVFEMSVITNSITRMMAVYVCYSPQEIGSLRSARHDFIPLAMGLDAVLVHWGGSHFALDKLDAGIMDNIDALKNPYNAFYRKKGIPRPHNGFTSMERLVNSAKRLGYRLENKFEGYPHITANSQQLTANSQQQINKTLKIGYPYPYDIKYQYNPETNSYWRWRGNQPEIDKNNGQQIEAKNIVIMRAASRQIEGPYYNDVDIEGSGECQVYQNGLVISCTWQKDKANPASKLYFLDESGQEIKFVPGQIWIEIVEPNQEVSWF
jgi:hypothetical protein